MQDESTWYATLDAGVTTLTIPGLWLTWVSNPILQFITMRWLFRIVIWLRFLWHVSRLDLALIPTHPDRNGGLGFLAGSAFAFAPILSAMGASLAGFAGGRIFHEGASLADFKLEIVLLVALGMLLALGPLTVFAPKILAAKRQGLREYGAFAAEYMRDFDRRWLRNTDRDGTELLGAADIQSLADIGNAFSVIREMSAGLFTRDTFVQLAFATLVPFVPLVFTLIPLEELLNRIIGAVL
jgi:hypothetical protein